MIETLARAVDVWLRRSRNSAPTTLPGEAGLKPATVVTGGSQGLGRSLGTVFADHGNSVMLVARHGEALLAAAESLEAQSLKVVHTLVLDVTAPDAFAKLEAALRENGLYLDILINNAGVGYCGAFLDQPVDELEQLLHLNVEAMTGFMRAALPAMIARGRGGVLNVASLGGFVPGPYQASYYASKAYVITLSVAVAREVKGLGVRVSVLTPGPIETSFHSKMGAETALYRTLIPFAHSAAVARSAYRGFKLGHKIIRPGLAANAILLALWLAPWPLSVPVVGWLLRPRGTDDEAR